MKMIEILLKIIDIATSAFMVMFAIMFALIALAALVCLIIEGDFMNIIGVVSGFILAWICWSVK